MKYIVVLCDGMADYPLSDKDNKTPMQIALTPNMDYLAKHGAVGLVKTVPEGMKPGSDICNLSILGYDPQIYYTGRSPLEAASIGIELSPEDLCLRCNLVTLSDNTNFSKKTMVDYSAGDISTDEAHDLIKALDKEFGNDFFSFYSGVSYRQCLVWHRGNSNLGVLTPPHDISGKLIETYLPATEAARPLLNIMRKASLFLTQHSINRKRIEKGLRPANAIWLWGEGTKASLPAFYEKYKLRASMISAVDLLKGIGSLIGMNVVEVNGATGYVDTNFDGKAKAAIRELNDDCDFVYVHIEAPDECAHRGETENKIRSIELIDRKIIQPIIKNMQKKQLDYKIMVLPDHPTPLCVKTHVKDPVPFLLYSSAREYGSMLSRFDEKHAASTGILVLEGHTLMQKFIDY